MIIAVVSGKGGVGKTTLVANLGATLSMLGKKILLMDLNISTPNLGLYLGFLSQERSIQKALEEETELKDCVNIYKPNLHLIVADFYNENCDLNFLRESLETLPTYDFIFLDGAAGIGKEVKETINACDKVLLIVNPTMFSIVSGAKIMKLVRKEGKSVEIIVNKWGIGPNHITLKKIRELLDAPIIGVVPFDKKIVESCERNEIFAIKHPNSSIAKEFRKITSHLTGLPLKREGVLKRIFSRLRFWQ